MTWMLTGGAGYIGAHIVRAFQDVDLPVVVLDDLSSGVRENVPDAVPFVQASVGDAEAVRAALREHRVTGVLHLAAKKAVGESVEKPLLYWDENVGGMRSLLQSCVDEGVDRVLFSSSAAVYGEPPVELVDETTVTVPISPYGETKLVGEWLTRAAATAHGLRFALLRYFNVAGAGRPELADTAVTNLIPMVFQRLAAGAPPLLFGDDYPTPDGSCVRDFIHVADLARAHVAALDHLAAGGENLLLNIGRGEGASVREVLAMVADVTGLPTDPEVLPRRAGDPPRVVASGDRIRESLDWSAAYDLRQMVTSAWEGWQAARS